MGETGSARRRRGGRLGPVVGRGMLATIGVAVLIAVTAATATPAHDTADVQRLSRPVTPQSPSTVGADGGVVPDAALPHVPALPIGPVEAPNPVSVIDPAGTGPVVPSRFVGGIPNMVLDAYQQATENLSATEPNCHLPVELLAAIGKVESGHARGGRVTANGTAVPPILGPVLDGNGFAAIGDTDGGRLDGSRLWDRAVGPMQFIPSTWRHWAADGNTDGVEDPENVFDASLAAARYLCANGRDLATDAGIESAILSYNDSAAYLRLVSAWLAAYRHSITEIADVAAPKAPVGTVAPPQAPVPPTTTTTAPTTTTTVVPPTTTSTAPTTTVTTTTGDTTTTEPTTTTDTTTTSPTTTTTDPAPASTTEPVESVVCVLGDTLGGVLGFPPAPCD